MSHLEPPQACDVLVVGSGVAGLSAALALEGLRVTLITKTQLGLGGSTSWAQGGVAVALAESDSPLLHASDTLAVAGDIGDADAVDQLTRRGPDRVLELIERGASFDRNAAGELHFGQEAAHSKRRILHAGGDATGAEISRALSEA
ncbi:MAG: FAD-dependent oxidoreductase, partial [Thermoanaerobaculia bacterium]|nr:FAD-dependent oxidoreductase [Thermoanaerobaculia bacterium]